MGGNELHEHIAIATGSTQGIGKAFVARFIKEGSCLFLADDDESTVDERAQVFMGLI